MLLVAVRNVAEAHKMSHVAREANVSRESLYKTLSSEGNPLLVSYRNVMNALGLKNLIAVPKDALIGENIRLSLLESTRKNSGHHQNSGKILYPRIHQQFLSDLQFWS